MMSGKPAMKLEENPLPRHTCPKCGNMEYRMVQFTPDGPRDITTCYKCSYSIGQSKPIERESLAALDTKIRLADQERHRKKKLEEENEHE